MYYTLRHEKWTFLLPVLCLCNLKSDWLITLYSVTLIPVGLPYVLTLRLLYTAENHCPAMSQRATFELRVLHAGLMYSTSLSIFTCLPYPTSLTLFMWRLKEKKEVAHILHILVILSFHFQLFQL